MVLNRHIAHKRVLRRESGRPAVSGERLRLRYDSFLGSGRDKEITYASWKDLDFDRGTFHVRRKEDVGFNPNSHETRDVPLPTDLLTMLKTAEKNRRILGGFS
jgi:integrase